jgi:hypothetical protein
MARTPTGIVVARAMSKAISKHMARVSIAKRYCLPTLDSSALRTIGSRGPPDLVS